MRAFHLLRLDDVSGVSGTGRVAEGVVFSNGLVALTWLSPYPTVAVYPSAAAVEAIHGHDGRTLVVPEGTTSRAEPGHEAQRPPVGGAASSLEATHEAAALPACPSFTYFWRNHYPEP